MTGLLSLVVIFGIIASARAQTNAMAPVTNVVFTTNASHVAVTPVTVDPFAQIHIALAYRSNNIVRLKAQIEVIQNKRIEETKRYQLAVAARGYNRAAENTHAASGRIADEKITALQRQIAALELEMFDIRTRYKIPEPKWKPKKH